MKNKIKVFFNIENMLILSVVFFFILSFFNNFNILNSYTSIMEINDGPSISITIDEETNYYDNLTEAINSATINETTTIVLHNNIELTNQVKIISGKNIIIDGNNHSITRGSTYTGNLFTVNSGGSLTIKNFTLDLNNNWTFNQEAYNLALANGTKITNSSEFVTPELLKPAATASVFINNGNIVLESSIIKNHYSNSASLFTSNANSSTKLIKSTVTHCASLTGTLLVYTTGTGTVFYIEDGTSIIDNYAGSNGGIFKIYNNSQVIMNGGEVKNTSSVNSNGVVAMMYGCTSTFTLNAGTISGNSGVPGKNNGRNGMIYLHSCGKFVMNGGVIENNTGTSTGGIDASRANSSIELNSGLIQNNKTLPNYENRSEVSLSYDYNLEIGTNMQINGNVNSAGAIVNNGNINGKLTLNMGNSTEVEVLSGTGTLTGDVIISHTQEEEPNYEITANVIGNRLPINMTTEYIVTYYYNGGKDELGLTNYRLVAVPDGEVPEVPTPLKKGHSVRWFSDSNLTIPWNITNITEDTVVYAGWNPNTYIVTWKSDNNTTIKKELYGSIISKPKDPVKTGYTFTGWSNYTSGMRMPDNNLTFVANFKINKYTVTFNSNGGSKVNSITQNYNTIISKTTDPTMLCRKFVGWYIDKELTKAYDFNSRLTKNITLYAKWEEDHDYGNWQEYDEEKHVRICKRDRVGRT